MERLKNTLEQRKNKVKAQEKKMAFESEPVKNDPFIRLEFISLDLLPLASDFKLYCAIRRITWGKNLCYKGVRGLAREANLNKETVVNALKRLVEKGLLEKFGTFKVNKKGNEVDHYFVVDIKMANMNFYGRLANNNTSIVERFLKKLYPQK